MRPHVIGIVPILLAGFCSSAWSQVPEPARCSVPSFIDVVGRAGGVPDPLGAVTIVIRDFTNSPVPGAVVTLDFGDCTDIRLALDQVPGVTLDCTRSTVSAITNSSGVASFSVLGASNVGCQGNAPGCGLNGVSVCANGVAIGNLSAAVYDLDGALSGDGVGPSELTAAVAGFNTIALGGPYRARYDYNHSATVTGADVALMNAAIAKALGGQGSRDGSGGSGHCGPPTTSFTCP
jgi:hypothetical protein